MIIECGNCHAQYDIQENLLKSGGSKFRCSNCKNVFMIYPPEGEGADPSESGPQKTEVLMSPTPQAPAPQVAVPKAPPRRQEPPRMPVERPDDSEELAEETFLIQNTLTNVDFSESVFTPTEIREKYEELGSIGKGGMGEVLLAKDTQLLRKVAIKVLIDNNPAALSYFLREAQITAQLDHPNIVPLYTVKEPKEGETNVSFVMKLIKGKDLHEVITKARKIYKQNPKAELETELALHSRLDYFLKACEGIAYAHRKGVVHRDLKPANIMIGDFGEVYVMDWGIAKMLSDDAAAADEYVTKYAQQTEVFTGDTDAGKVAQTQIGGVVGTLSYMSPEQAKGLPDVDHRSDIFSLGAVLYELTTLKPARVGNPQQKLKWAQGGYLNTIEHMVPEQKISPELKNIIEKTTDFSPRDRYQSVSALARDVRNYLRGDEVSVLPDNLPRKVWRWMSKHREITVIALMAILLIFSSFALWSYASKLAAAKEARIREKQLTQLQGEVSRQAHAIDSHFLRLENLAVNLVNEAIYLIQDAPDNKEKFYWIAEFKDENKAPRDYVYSELYKKKVSIDYPVVKTAPNVKHETVAPLMQRLAPLRHHFKKTLLASTGNDAPIASEEARRLLMNIGVPIRWAFIGLDAGVMYSYPGKETYSDAYDPRLRPWYADGFAGQGKVKWGNPYLDAQGLGLVLPCAKSLYDKEKRFYGVLGMDVTFTDIIKDTLTREDAKGRTEAFILNEKAQVVVRTSQLGREVKMEGAKLVLKPFHIQEVKEDILKGESDSAIFETEDKTRLFVYYKMRSLNWYYVEELETAKILESE